MLFDNFSPNKTHTTHLQNLRNAAPTHTLREEFAWREGHPADDRALEVEAGLQCRRNHRPDCPGVAPATLPKLIS